jgi:hypothetical protein
MLDNVFRLGIKMLPNQLSSSMHKAIGLERIYTNLLDHEALAEDGVRDACEQAIERTYGQLDPTEQAMITSLRFRLEYMRLEKQGVSRADNAFGKWHALQRVHRIHARRNPEVQDALINEFLFMVGDQFEYYDEDGEVWTGTKTAQDAEVVHLAHFITGHTIHEPACLTDIADINP